MIELLEAHWLLALIALLFGLLLAWYVFQVRRRTRITGAARDVLDEGASPAERNRALIDTPPAALPVVPVAPPARQVGTGAAVAAATEQTHASPPSTMAEADDLARLKGVGPKLVATLNQHGVTRFAQIAAWDDAEIDRIDAQLGRFQGRIRRDDWVGQARLLAAGDETGYSGRYGNLS